MLSSSKSSPEVSSGLLASRPTLSSISSAKAKPGEAYQATLVDCLAQVAHLSQAEKLALVFAKHSESKPTAVQRYG